MTGTPNRVQERFRFRSDADTVDATPTWLAAENTNINLEEGASFRLRFQIRNTGSATTGNQQWSLRYSLNGSATYVAITTTSVEVQSADVGASADDASLTVARLTAPGSGSFGNGQYDETGATGNIAIATGNYTEIEFGLQTVKAFLIPNDTLDFRVYAGGVALQAYTVTPRITVTEAPVDVSLVATEGADQASASVELAAEAYAVPAALEAAVIL